MAPHYLLMCIALSNFSYFTLPLCLLQERIALQHYQQCNSRQLYLAGKAGSLENGPRSGRLATVTTEKNIDRVHHLMRDDRRLTINEVSNAICTSRERV